MANNIWRYENYGTASLLKISGNTVTDLPASKSKTGSAFWQNQRVATFPIPATKELWVKFDLYYGNAQWRAYDRLNGNDTGVGRYQQANTITSFINGPLQYQLNPQNTLTNNRLKTYLLHMVSDAENGLVELWVDGVKYYSDDFASEGLIYKGNVEGGADFDNFYLQSASSANLFSNVIISNTRIGLGENVIGQGLSSYLDFDIVRVVDKSIVPVSVDFDTVRDVNSSRFPLTLNFDTARDIWRSWRYENYGTGDLLLVENVVTEEVPVTFSITGHAYVAPCTSPSATLNHFDIPTTDKIWIKFDISFGLESDKQGTLRIIIGNGSDKFSTIDISWGDYGRSNIFAIEFRYGTLYASDYSASVTKLDMLHRILIYAEQSQVILRLDNSVVPMLGLRDFSNIQNVALLSDTRNDHLLISNVIISNTPIDISENVATVSFPCELTLDIGAYRYVQNGIWRYENYGTDELLTFTTQTVSDLPVTQSKTGSAFTQKIESNCFSIAPTDEVWLQFDFYVAQYGLITEIDAGIINTTQAGTIFQSNGLVRIKQTSTGLETKRRTDLTQRYSPYKYYNYSLSDNTLNTVLLHLKIGTEESIYKGLIECWINGTKIGEITGNVNDGQHISELTVYDFDGDGILFSNVIISNVTPNLKILQADLCRVLHADLFVLLADTVRTLPHKVFSAPIEHSGDTPDIHNTSAGLQNFEIRLAEQQLTDFVNFTITKPINIMEQVKGQYLDYLFDMRVESLKQRGILRTCNCCSDIDNLLYKQIEYSVPPNEQWHNPDDPFWQQHHQNVEDDIPKALASQHVNHIATVLGKQPVIRFADFVSTVDISAGGSTYADLIRNIFGWSSRIPHKMINCFLRNSYLYVIQRGFEDNLIDLSNAVTDIVSFDRELVRTTWGSSLWAKTEIRSKFLGWREVYNRDDYKAKKSSFGDANYSYDNDGLISHTSIYNGDGSTTYIDYQYKTLASGRKILVSESHSVFKDGVQIDYQQIIHTPLEQGQSHAMAIGQDGDYLGSNVGQSTGDDRVTPYEKFSRVLESVYAEEQRTINGITLFDTSFPVYGDDKLAEITAAIRWLNRKTQETAILNLYDFPHVVDFNDRILLNGNEYYLKSNTTLQNTRIVNKQTLSLVRWF